MFLPEVSGGGFVERREWIAQDVEPLVDLQSLTDRLNEFINGAAGHR